MPEYKHILTDFKDLRKVIGEITAAKPAKTRYQQQAKKMNYRQHNEAEAQPADKKKAGNLKKMKDHAGEEEIKKAYIELGTAAQGSVEFQRKLIQKKLKEMGYNTYSKLAFDTIFNRPLQKEDVEKLFTLTELFSKKQIKMMRSAYGNLGTIDPSSSAGKKLLNKFSSMQKDELIDIAAAGINFLSLLAASNLITRFGMKPGSFKYQQAGESVNEAYGAAPAGAVSAISDMIDKRYSVSKIAKEMGLSTSVVTKIKKYIDDINDPKSAFNSKYSKATQGEETKLEEGLFSRIAVDIDHGDNAQKIAKKYKLDLGVVKQMFKDIEKVQKASPNFIRKNENDPLKEGKYLKYSDLLLKKSRLVDLPSTNRKAIAAVNKEIEKEMKKLGISEEILGEGEISDVEVLMKKGWDAKRIGKKKGYSPRRIKALANMMILMKQLQKIESASAKLGFKPYQPSRSQQVQEEHDHAKQSPFKLKSQQYPRAIAINTDGFGKRHATVEDIISACDSFGMIIDKELQVEQIQKQLGKKGFISYKKSELEDVFEERETERMILALESDVEEQTPIEYTQGEIAYAQLHEREVEFLKPDGQKAKGPVLKMSGNTFNIKDKFTGKSFTYKYSGKDVKLEEEKVKTFKQIIDEVSIGPATIRKDFPNVWAQKDDRMNNILMALVNMHGYVDNLKAYKKDKKKFVDDLKKIGKNDASLKKAGLTKRNIGEEIQEGKFSKQLIKQAGGIAFDKRYYQSNMTGAVKAIEKLKKGLSDDPKVQELLRIANESSETTDYTNWLPEGGDKEAYKKFFNAALKKFGVSSPDELEGEKKKKFFDYVDKNWKGDHEEVEIKLDGRRKNFREKMKKLGYIKGT